ncbi:hypothetical protein [Sphingomonas soli]|nr:hypothetical protein [Sphingomonas soli]
MDETLERDAADETAAMEHDNGVVLEVTEPKAYVFDGWGMTPLEL